MVDKLKKAYAFIVTYYYSFLLCGTSLWLASVLRTVGHTYIALAVFFIVLIKLVGICTYNNTLRIIGVVGLSGFWIVNATIFYLGYHPSVELTYHFPLIIFLLAFGIALRGRFDG